MTPLPQHRVLVHALLENPGDEVTRLALADLAEEKGINLECLRHAGGHWRIVWDREERCWWLKWDARWDKPSQWMGKKPIVWRVGHDVVGVCSLTQKELPRCVHCGGRAHVSLPPLWQWECGGQDADVAKRCQARAYQIRRMKQSLQAAADLITAEATTPPS